MPKYQVTVVQTWHLTVEADHEFEAENKALALDFSLECDDSDESVYAVLIEDDDSEPEPEQPKLHLVGGDAA